MNSTEFGKRMTGSGEIAESISQLFEVTCKKYGLNEQTHRLRKDLFIGKQTDQIDLF